MVHTCLICKWRSDKNPRRSFHKFPTNQKLKQEWLKVLGKNDVSIGSRTSLCHLHFEENCFRYGLVNGRRILQDGSIPSLRQIIINHEKKQPNLKSSTENAIDATFKTNCEENSFVPYNHEEVIKLKKELLIKKKKILSLRQIVKHLRNSRDKTKSKLAVLRNKRCKCELDNKLIYVNDRIQEIISKIKERRKSIKPNNDWI